MYISVGNPNPGNPTSWLLTGPRELYTKHDQLGGCCPSNKNRQTVSTLHKVQVGLSRNEGHSNIAILKGNMLIN